MSEITTAQTTDEQFLTARDLMRSTIKSLMPDLDFGNGTALNDLIITPAAKLAAAELVREANVYASYDLNTITEDTDVTIINNILSRYFVDPAAGASASGQLKIITDSTATLIIPQSLQFVTVSGLVFKTTQDIRVFETAAQRTNTDDLVFVQQGDLFYFLLPVVAAEPGDAYNIVAGTVFDINDGYDTVTSITAYSDFLGGDSEESPADAIKRLPDRFGAQTTGMVSSIKKLISEKFGITDVSAVTSNNTAMLRSARNPVGLPVGGYCDLYVRSNVRGNSVTETKAATLIDPVTGKWRINLDSAYAGTYKISVAPVGATGSFEIVTKVVGIEFADELNHPTVTDTQDATFSSVQTLLVEFIDDVASAATLTAGATRNYDVTIISMPSILEISNYLNQEDVGSPGVDLLVRGVTPVFLSASLTIKRNTSDPVVDVAAIKTDIVNSVFELGIGRKYIDGTTIIGAVQKNLGQRSFINMDSFSLEAKVLDHQLNESIVVGAKYIDIVERPEDGITKDTIGFLIRESDINVTVEDYA